MQVEIVREGQAVYVTIGPGGMTRPEAFHAVQEILDQAIGIDPTLAQVAAVAWRRKAEDGSVHAGLFEWRIYEHRADESPQRAAMDLFENSPWVTDWDAGGEDFSLHIRYAIDHTPFPLHE